MIDKLLILVVTLSALTLSPSSARAEEGSGRQPAAGSRCRGGEVNLNFVDAELPAVIRFVAEVTGRRFILSGAVQAAPITIFSPRPICRSEVYEVFLSVLAANNLTVVRRGGYHLITTAEDAVRSPIPLVIERDVHP